MENAIDIDEIKRRAGSGYRLAAELGLSHQAIYNWRRVPVHHVRRVAELTGLSREQIRPDIFAVTQDA